MRRYTTALLVASSILFGCGGSGSGPYQKGFDLAAIAGDYDGTYTMSVTDSRATGTAEFTLNPDGTVRGLLIPATDPSRHVAWYEVTGTIGANGVLTGQAVYDGETPFDFAGTVVQNEASKLRFDVVSTGGTAIAVDLARAQAEGF